MNSSIILFALGLFVFINPTIVWSADEIKVNNQYNESISRLPAPEKSITQPSPQPSPLSEEERFSTSQELEDANQVPDLLVTNTSIIGPENGTQTNSTNSTNFLIKNDSLLKPTSINSKDDEVRLKIVKNTTLTPIDVGYVLESSVASFNGSVFYTGNLFAANSFDDGSTWKYLNIRKDVMKTTCCDNDVIYDPIHGMFLWYLQGTKEMDGANTLALGISKDNLKSWQFIKFKPTNINETWVNQASDYPYLALSNGYLYISMNMMKNSPFFDPQSIRPIVLRISLTELAAGLPPAIEYYADKDLPSNAHSFTLVQGANDTMYWGIHISNDKMKLYKWNDSLSSGSVVTYIRSVPPWTPLNRGEGECIGPNDINWCARGQSKIRGAFTTNNIVGFIWDANKNTSNLGSDNNATGFRYPYIDAATFDVANNMTYLSRPLIWNPDYAWMYGYTTPDKQGNIGIQAFFGGGKYNPSIAVGFANDLAARNPWHLIPLVNGTDGPAGASFMEPSSWGDFVRIRPSYDNSSKWVGSGWTLQGGHQANNIEPRFFEFTLVSNNVTNGVDVSNDQLLNNDRLISTDYD
jgi:hypothetical protein